MKRIIMLLLAMLWLQGCSGEKSTAKTSLFKEDWDTATTIGSKLEKLDVTNYYTDSNSTYLSFNESKGNFGYRFETDKNIEQLKSGVKALWRPVSDDSMKLYREITGDDFLKRVSTLDDSWANESKNELNIINTDKVAINKKIETNGNDAMITVSWDFSGTTFMTIPDRSPVRYSEAFCYINADARDNKLWIEKVNCEAHISRNQLPVLKEAFINFAREFHGGTSLRMEKELVRFLDESFDSSDEPIKKKIELKSQPYAKWEIGRGKSEFYNSSDGGSILDIGFTLYND